MQSTPPNTPSEIDPFSARQLQPSLKECLQVIVEARGYIVVSHPQWLIIDGLIAAITHEQSRALTRRELVLLYRVIGMISIAWFMRGEEKGSKLRILDRTVVELEKRMNIGEE